MSESWQIVEALLFASPDVLSTKQLANASDLAPSEVETCIARLNKDYEEQGRAFQVRDVAGGWQLVTLQRFSPWIARLLSKRRQDRLSKAALETLAVIAHRQPINKPDIDQARGIDSSYILASLLERGLVKIKGRDKRAGHPYVYGTTPKFLEFFGLTSLEDLPDIEEPALKEEDILPLDENEEPLLKEPQQESETSEDAEIVGPDALSAIGYKLASSEENGEDEDQKEGQGDDIPSG